MLAAKAARVMVWGCVRWRIGRGASRWRLGGSLLYRLPLRDSG